MVLRCIGGREPPPRTPAQGVFRLCVEESKVPRRGVGLLRERARGEVLGSGQTQLRLAVCCMRYACAMGLCAARY
jgi:hypothetical protein